MGEESVKDSQTPENKPAEKTPKVYFGVHQTNVFRFPEDENQFIEFKKLNEGERQLYEDRTGRQLSMDKNSDNVKMDLSAGKDRAVLFSLMMTKYSFYIMENDKPVLKQGDSKNRAEWEQLVKEMDGELAQSFFEEVKRLNVWIKANETEVKVEQKK